MQCFQSAKPVIAVWHDLTSTVKAKLDFVFVKKVFQNVNKHLRILKAVNLALHGLMRRHFLATASI